MVDDIFHECYCYDESEPEVSSSVDPLDFISKFNKAEPLGEAFVNGKCYWFAKILEERFKYERPSIMYNPISGHFTTRIKGRFYDINGDVTAENERNSFMWDKLDDPEWKSRIERDCIEYANN